MPENPFDSFTGRLRGLLRKTAKDATAAEREGAEPRATDSFAARLQKALEQAEGGRAETALPAPTDSTTARRLTDVAAEVDTGPVGEGAHVVRAGDCLDSIAVRYGFFWRTIWTDPANTALREMRGNPNVLLPGDEVTIPEKRRKDEPGATEQRHRFRRRGLPARLRMRFLEVGEPRSGEPYTLDVDGRHTAGNLDDEGLLDVPIPPDARRAVIRIGDDRDGIRLMLGSLDPITEISGVQGRLNNLAYEAGPITGEMNERTREALRRFQAAHQLEATGEPESATRSKLLRIHGA